MDLLGLRNVSEGAGEDMHMNLVSKTDEEFFAHLVPRMVWVREELMQHYNWHLSSNFLWYIKVTIPSIHTNL